MGFLRSLRKMIYRFLYLKRIDRKIESTLFLQAGLLHRSNMGRVEDIIKDIRNAEFRVFSQWGDDGIIQFLIDYLDVPSETFVEFGVENYQEANTRYLMMNNQWKGLVMDGNEQNIREIKEDETYWKYDLTGCQAFITKENINELLTENGFTGEIGLLSIDIDGNDYWIWDAISVIEPVIVVVEYNALFGSERTISIPYQADFFRTRAHYSNLYFGASIAALCWLADKKGYSFIGCTSSGNNAYFVRNGFLKDLQVKSPEEGYVLSFSRESRDQQGRLTYLSGDDRLNLLRGLEVVNVVNGNREEV